MALLGFGFSKAALDYVATRPLKHRRQLIKRAKALMLDPHPQGSIELKAVKCIVANATAKQ